ncbi:PASTA domain-containing protein [Ohtaekwangia koreensis]|uniref:PASTA domain, binds beta-lactams n=1 Tax=Ohtaekwangia koreensis TaxID=688867 RepID=A0A1T5MFF9_9BACT|nr:PASTA domain-containing protein [Ohtaekwangia koreensis]SKC86648.1 PASTA domain, binds beta-lactams [Ohtaekwangia koreensis]
MKLFPGKFAPNTLGGILISLALAWAIIFVFIALYFFTYLPSVTNHGQSITVPNIEGMQVKELEDFLIRKDLRYEVSDSTYSSKYPPLTVLKQYPHAGAKVKQGRKIFITINHVTAPTVPVPNLIDGSVVNAEAVLASNELKRGRIELVSGPFNVVKEMKYRGAKIEPNVRVPKGSVIDLVVMDGGKGDYTMDNMVGQEFEDAKVYILGANLNLGTVTTTDDTVGIVPVVIKQIPEAGEKIKAGDVVDLWIGKPESVPSDDDDEQL